MILQAQTADALKEKKSAALSSVLAAIGLVVFKSIVGVLTGSLGILAEAAHSALDLIAALMTYFAVKISGRPADSDHPYGHGKVENLSALFEALLLIVTCVWIVYEAIHRLFYKPVDVEVTVWSFAVMIFSIVVDISRSRNLSRAAKKHHSQALEADALHFSTDVWSSTVVIFGLVCVLISEKLGSVGYLKQADAIAALAVVAIVVYVSIQLGLRTVRALTDTAPAGLKEKIITIVESLPNVKGCHNVRARYSGAQVFIDIHVLVDGEQTLREAHNLTEQIEEKIDEILPGADITIHPEPFL